MDSITRIDEFILENPGGNRVSVTSNFYSVCAGDGDGAAHELWAIQAYCSACCTVTLSCIHPHVKMAPQMKKFCVKYFCFLFSGLLSVHYHIKMVFSSFMPFNPNF